MDGFSTLKDILRISQWILKKSKRRTASGEVDVYTTAEAMSASLATSKPKSHQPISESTLKSDSLLKLDFFAGMELNG